jgi:hypothetical protein
MKMKATAEVNCSTCKFCLVGDIDPNNVGGPRALNCQFNPPQLFPLINPQGIQWLTQMPFVQRNMVCGQWKPAEQQLTVIK